MDDQAKLLRIYTDEAAYFGDLKVFEVIASRAREAKLVGATILEALLGFGVSTHVHRPNILQSDRALVIEIIDRESSLRSFVTQLDDIPDIGLITLEAVEVLGGKAREAIQGGR